METNSPKLDDLSVLFTNQLQRDAKVLRCYQCGRILPRGYDDVEAHSPRCPRLLTMEVKNQ